MLKSRSISGWVGTIRTLSSNGDGKGVLSIAIGDKVEVKTWNNSFSDVFDNTLLDPASSIFQTLTALKTGQKVKFSGEFVTSAIDCVKESSLTMAGSMTEPEFILRFKDVQTP